jgi:hypothetical protein
MLALALVFPSMPFNVYDVLDYQTWAEQLGIFSPSVIFISTQHIKVCHLLIMEG